MGDRLRRTISASRALALLLSAELFLGAPSPAEPSRRSSCVSETSEASPALPVVDRLVFEPSARGLPRSGQWRDGFAVADVNEDGRPDVVHGAPRAGAGRPAIFLGGADGAWTPWQAARFGPTPLDYGDAAVGDFDGDGHADLALAVHLRGIVVLEGDGKGVFQVAGENASGPGAPYVSRFSSRAIEVADLDGDGRPEIVALGEGPGLGTSRSSPGADAGGLGVRFLRRGDAGGWVERDVTSARGFGMAIATGDLDGDARTDIVAASSVTGNRALFHLAGPNEGEWTSPELGCLPDDVLVWGVAVADFDKDRHDDVVLTTSSFAAGRWTSGVDVLLARDSRSWLLRSVVRETARIGATAVAAGDLDGDGRLDIVFLDASGRVRALLGKGDGTFVRENAPEGLTEVDGCRGYHVAVTDLDSDGLGDIVAAFAGEPLRRRGDPRRACPTGGRLLAWKSRRRTDGEVP